MSTERDTHFQNAAKLLLQALMTKYDHLPPGEYGPAEKDELIIAHFAYDLAQHVLNGNETLQWKPLEEISVRDIPDLTEWPERS